MYMYIYNVCIYFKYKYDYCVVPPIGHPERKPISAGQSKIYLYQRGQRRTKMKFQQHPTINHVRKGNLSGQIHLYTSMYHALHSEMHQFMFKL